MQDQIMWQALSFGSIHVIMQVDTNF